MLVALRRQRQVRLCEFETSLVYRMSSKTGSKATEKPCVKKERKKERRKEGRKERRKEGRKEKRKENKSERKTKQKHSVVGARPAVPEDNSQRGLWWASLSSEFCH